MKAKIFSHGGWTGFAPRGVICPASYFVAATFVMAGLDRQITLAPSRKIAAWHKRRHAAWLPLPVHGWPKYRNRMSFHQR
jgi:hypothetical protein